ncbi:hypothetical protein CORC01_04752 [Colletotrichum orchidophilum]|uniref:Uncharacterized protein n=1 Tax=Colletotrichum orchidophilum TaxID=1209926 RepID=A0A1G4BEK7_9PEZI|nr:uncharacterized protein CORC01_04752 [Colletotrichum orchidophilum]OHE99851.1 hypothetical protein CORC01_04752 [Colletotrichum orchidophilum]
MDSVCWDICPDAEDPEDPETSEEEVDQDRNTYHTTSSSSSSSSARSLHPPHPSSSLSSSNIAAATPDAIPEVVLQHLPEDDDDNDSPPDTTMQKSTLSVPEAPTFASVYTNSPSWMSTYTSSTCATTYTSTHERSRRDGDGLEEGGGHVGDGWLDVRRRRSRLPYPRRPRTVRRWDGDGGMTAAAAAAAAPRSRPRWREETLEAWDEAEMESGSYCVVEGARWEEQRFVTLRRPARGKLGKGKGGGRRREAYWSGVVGYSTQRERARTRSIPLVDPPVPKIVVDLLAMGMSRSRSRLGGGLWGLPYVEGRGHSRAVFAMAAGDRVWSVVLRYLGDVLGFSRRVDGSDDVD